MSYTPPNASDPKDEKAARIQLLNRLDSNNQSQNGKPAVDPVILALLASITDNESDAIISFNLFKSARIRQTDEEIRILFPKGASGKLARERFGSEIGRYYAGQILTWAYYRTVK